jgi:hypothetical protein
MKLDYFWGILSIVIVVGLIVLCIFDKLPGTAVVFFLVGSIMPVITKNSSNKQEDKKDESN